MAISDKIIVTGTAGGEAGMVNVGTGRNVTWPTSGNPTFALTGVLFVGTDNGGVSAVNITTAADRGTLKPWGTGADAKPHWATGPGFVECPQSVTGRRFSLISDSEAAALNSELTDGLGQAEIDFEGGYLFTVGFQLYTDPSTIQHTAEPTITPANAPGMQSMHEFVNGGGSTLGQFRINPTNVGGFRPGALIANGGYTSQGEDWLPSNQGSPYGHLCFNEWYPLQVWIRRATSNGANDGEIRWYLGKTLVSRQTGVNIWVATNAWRLEHWASLGSGWNTARTGLQFRWCAPLKIQAVPEADLPNALIDCWQRNTELGLDLRRLWPVQCPVYPITLTTVTGTPTVPTFGRTINAGGVFPGICELPLAGDAGEEQMIEFPAVWDGDSDTTPFGPDGWTHISLNTFFPNGGRLAFRVRNAADSANIAEVVFDDSGTGSFTINGVSTLTGRTDLPEKKRWQIVLSLTAGETRVTLVNQTTDSLTDATLCKVFTSANTYVAGTAIGKPQASGRNVNAMCVRAGSCSVHAEYTVTVGDSFTSAGSATNTYAISGVNQGTKTFTVATMQSGTTRTRRPVAGDSVLVTGTNAGWYTVASATDTTITVVEAIPSATADGAVDLGSPVIHCLANRLAQHFPNRYDSDAIAPHYRFGHPLLDNFLNKLHPLVNLARSGGRLTELLTSILPNCTLMPKPKVLSMCFDVNDTTATTTAVSMIAQAKSLADNKKLLIDWVIARGGKIILTEGMNGQNAGVVLNGWAPRFRRVTPVQVWQNLEYLVRALTNADRNVTMLRPPAFMPAGSITMAGDGLHPDSATAIDYDAAMHLAAEATENSYGVNANDGTIQAIGGRSGFGGGG